MKKIIALGLMLSFGLVMFAQQTESYVEVMRSALKTEKKAMVAEVMTFTPEEAELFWPLYNEFQGKLYVTNTKYVKIVNEFAANFDNMTDEKALDLVTRMSSYDGELLKLKKTYIKKFSKIIPPTKVLRYYQAENKIDMIVKYEMASSIPFLETE